MVRIGKRLWIVELFFQNYLSWLARSFSWPRGSKKCWSIELFSIVRNSWYVSIVYIYIYLHMYKSFEQFQKPQLVTIIRDYITTHYVGADHNPWTGNTEMNTNHYIADVPIVLVPWPMKHGLFLSNWSLVAVVCFLILCFEIVLKLGKRHLFRSSFCR